MCHFLSVLIRVTDCLTVAQGFSQQLSQFNLHFCSPCSCQMVASNKHPDCSCHTTILQAPEGAPVKRPQGLTTTVTSASFRSRSGQSCLPSESKRRSEGKKSKKNKEWRRRETGGGGQGMKSGLAVFWHACLFSVLLCPFPNLPPPHACLQSSALHYFIKYLLRWQAWLFFLSLFLILAYKWMHTWLPCQ